MLKVLQWNVRGLNSSTADLSPLLDHYDPDMLLLQETWTGKKLGFHFPGMRVYHLPRKGPAANGAFRGGILTAFKESLPNILSCKATVNLSTP